MEDKQEKPDINSKDKAIEDKREETLNKISNSLKIFSLLSGALLVLIVLISVVTVYTNAQKTEATRLKRMEQQRIAAEKFAQEQSVRAEQERQEAIAKKEKAIWDSAIALRDEAMAEPDKINSAIAKFKELKTGLLEGTAYVKKIDPEVEALKEAKEKAIGQIVAGLEKKASDLADKLDFESASSILINYTGTFAEETKSARLKTAQAHMEAGRKKLAAKKQFKQDRNELLKGISSMITKNKIPDALVAYNEFMTKYASEKIDDLAPLKNILESVGRPEKFFLESFRNDIGGKTTAKINGQYETVEISRVKEESVYVKKAVGAATVENKISLENLQPEEKLRRSDRMDKDSRAVYTAMIEVEAGNYDSAEKAIEPGGLLSEYLLVCIRENKSDGENKKDTEPAKVNVKDDSTTKEFVVAPQHITIRADGNTKNTTRETMLGDIYILQDINFKTSLSNTAPVDFSGHKIEIYVIGENIADKHVCQVLAIDKRDLNLKKKESIELEVKANTEFNKLNVNKYGAEYCGYFIVIKDKDDKVFTTKTNKVSFQKFADKIMKMEESSEFDDRNGEEAKGTPAPKRRDR